MHVHDGDGQQVSKWHLRLILDRVDIHLEVARFATVNKPNVQVNGDMVPDEVQKFCQLDKEGLAMIRMAVERMRLSARLSSHP